MTISRGWTLVNDTGEVEEGEREKLDAECDELARRWSALQSEIENEGFDRQARYEDGADSFDPYEDEDEATAKTLRAGDDMRRELKSRARQTELETIEAMLAERGGRMMRPYEHWNEDERYMAWAEGEG
jgi:hypothetical protein